MIFQAYILGMLKYEPIHGWVLKSIGIYSGRYPPTNSSRRTVFIPMLHEQPFEGTSWGEAHDKAVGPYNRLKTVYDGVQFLHG